MASYQYVYTMHQLGKAYGNGKKVLENVTLSFMPGAKIGVLGPNGAGKSTLLKIMAGLDKDFTGEAWAAEGAKVGYLEQEPQLDESKTVAENVMEGMRETKDMLDRYNAVAAAVGEPDADFDGEKRRVALCKLLLEKPDLLLLDEPTNHLDAESVAWLQRFLEEYKGTVVMVTHDRYFLDNVTGWILEVDRGSGIPYQGNYSAYLDAKRKRMEQEAREDDVRSRTLKRERDWMGQSPSARRGYVDQSRDSLDPEKNVWEEISGGTDIIQLGKIEMQSRAYVSAFNFRGADQQKLVGTLSGGQRNRVHLAKMLKKEANVILLDEPTNDLDTETLAALEEAIERFPGCAVIISHDRWFLDRLATHILAFEGNSQVTWFEGNYEDYEKDYKRRMGVDADQPQRIKYRPLSKAS